MAFLLFLFLSQVSAIDNGLGVTPPIGWRSWNQFQCNVNQDLIESIYDALIAKDPNTGISLASVGYTRPGLDDCWQLCNSGPGGKGFHDANGNPIIDTSKFPDMGKMVAHGHANGLLPEWYMNNCACADPCNTTDCFQGDVNAIVGFDFDGVKLDGCGGEKNVSLWAQLLNDTGRPVLIENCHNGPNEPTPGWCPFNYFRTSDDIRPTYASVANNLQSVRPWVNLTGPGCWPYPDMLEVGVTNSQTENVPTLNYVEARSHFGAWCVVSSPLVLGFDLTNETTVQSVWDIITNTEAININQQWAGFPGDCIAQSTKMVNFTLCDWEGDNCTIPSWQIWSKPVTTTGSVAILFMNHDTITQTLSINWANVPYLKCTTCNVRDIWNHGDLGSFANSFTTKPIASHDSTFIVVSS